MTVIAVGYEGHFVVTQPCFGCLSLGLLGSIRRKLVTDCTKANIVL